jgi:1,4-dihydroxy-2-naphthoyl-CoA hydrolase
MSADRPGRAATDLENWQTTFAAAFVFPTRVRFQDVDAAKVVFFPRVLEYFHDAYVAFLDERRLGLPEVLAKGEWGLPIRHAEADYMAPLRFGDSIEVAIVAKAIEEHGFSLCYRVVRMDAGGPVVAAVGETRHVAVSVGEGRPRRRPLPPEVAAALAVVPDRPASVSVG